MILNYDPIFKSEWLKLSGPNEPRLKMANVVQSPKQIGHNILEL